MSELLSTNFEEFPPHRSFRDKHANCISLCSQTEKVSVNNHDIISMWWSVVAQNCSDSLGFKLSY